ncbi:MAG: chromate transporter [Sedimentibacter sp.]|uniref:chromate transporter n=1 Tax=Sedimentibacter sp. TaxID=1960295 RepID=UPI00315900D9
MNKHDIRQLKDIFIAFFTIGLFTFGGGYAMIPLIEREIVEKKKWIERKEITDIFAVSQSIPGAIAINSATFIGFKIYGRKGALAATLGVILPSFFIISVIASYFNKFGNNLIIKSIFSGIRPAVVSLIFFAVYKVGKTSISDKTGFLISIIGMLLVVVFNVHAIFVIIGGAVFGLAVYKLWPNKADEILRKEVKNDDIP